MREIREMGLLKIIFLQFFSPWDATFIIILSDANSNISYFHIKKGKGNFLLNSYRKDLETHCSDFSAVQIINNQEASVSR